MNILFINSPECDYVQDLLYSGLVKILSQNNVIDYPHNPRYHWRNKNYPRNLGLNRNWQFLFRPKKNIDLKHFDFVIIGSCKKRALSTYLEILPKIPSSTPVIMIDGGDLPGLGEDLTRENSPWTFQDIQRKRPFDYILKREYLIHDSHPQNVYPFPMSMNMLRIPPFTDSVKKYDVSFWAVESHPIRTKALGLLQKHFDCLNNGTTLNQTFHKYKRKGKFYLEELHRCKIVLNFRGAGWDTLRYWEVPAVKSLLITQKPQIVIPNDFNDHEHVLHCKDDLSDLIDLCDYSLKNEKERETIAQAGHQHLLDHHTDIHRANYLLKIIGK
ncbi:MAG: glycosyltransferase family 1 protein [Bdellovibrionaceae bacterium]|nr:glycosyltransferase family 1 protein [Pseudobdellovibrionaceae bacterium]